MKNFYEVLRVKTNASSMQIKRAYIQLVTKYHPDIYPGDKKYAERYTAVLTEAYFVLKDEDRRKDYDFSHNINIKKWDKYIKSSPSCECPAPSKKASQRETAEYLVNRKRRTGGFFYIIGKIFKSKVFIAFVVIVALSFGIATLIYWK